MNNFLDIAFVFWSRSDVDRDFVKNHLPRIRYANPNLDIEVQKVPKTPEERWRPELEVELGALKKPNLHLCLALILYIPPSFSFVFSALFQSHTTPHHPSHKSWTAYTVDGKVEKLDMNAKWSTSITKELMNLSGGEEWQRHVFSCKNAGLPILPGEDVHEIEERKLKAKPSKTGEKLPTLAEYLKAHPEKAKKDAENQQKANQLKEKKNNAKTDTSPSTPSNVSESPSSTTN